MSPCPSSITLSLIHVDNYKNQISKALRICQPDSQITFSVWVEEKICKVFNVRETIFAQNGYGIKPGSETDHYQLGKVPEELKIVME